MAIYVVQTVRPERFRAFQVLQRPKPLVEAPEVIACPRRMQIGDFRFVPEELRDIYSL